MKSSCRGVGRALLGPNIERSGKSLHGKLLGGSFWSWELLVRHKLSTAKPRGVGWAQVKVQKGRDRRHKKTKPFRYCKALLGPNIKTGQVSIRGARSA